MNSFKKRKMLMSFVVMALLIVMVVAVSGCGKKTPEPTTPGAPPPPAQTKYISIATASTAGAWYPLGGGIAMAITKHIPGVVATAETGAATVENIRNMIEGNVELAFLQSDVLWEAYNGKGRYEGNAMNNLRGLYSTYGTVAHFITLAKYDFNTLADFKGKSIGVGAPASGTEIFNQYLLEKFGITYDNIDEQFLGVPDQVEGLKNENVHLSMSLMPVPTASFMELAVTHGIKLIGLDAKTVKEIEAERPGWFGITIPAGSYQGVNYDVVTAAYRGNIGVMKDMDEELAYQITKVTWEKRDEWKDTHAVAKDFTIDTALEGMPIPLHPGAIRYYREIGMTIPAELIPPEMK
ncbi:MAG: TAXI family TRAP transporter solute-binding subunit [Dethiobacter sp.]|jgi:TRAP transporter TAXI family solute receptor|nr:TAXI family TRAP transporter solute-binding subunit [Dethiobacter sp.]